MHTLKIALAINSLMVCFSSCFRLPFHFQMVLQCWFSDSFFSLQFFFIFVVFYLYSLITRLFYSSCSSLVFLEKKSLFTKTKKEKIREERQKKKKGNVCGIDAKTVEISYKSSVNTHLTCTFTTARLFDMSYFLHSLLLIDCRWFSNFSVFIY